MYYLIVYIGPNHWVTSGQRTIDIVLPSGIFTHAPFDSAQVVHPGITAFYEINKFSNSLYGISSYQIFDISCLTSIEASAAFVNVANIISTLSAGKLRVLPTDTAILTTYHFCLKAIDDSGYGY